MAKIDVGDPSEQRQEHRAVFNFSKIMLEKLLKNAHKGDWRKVDYGMLYDRGRVEMQELLDALGRYHGTLGMTHLDPTEQHTRMEMARRAVSRECADVANFMLMIADVVGGLEDEYDGLAAHLMLGDD